MSLVLTGINFVITTFMLMAINGAFCFFKIPVIAIPVGFFTWIIFFVLTLNIGAFEFILIMLTLFFATANIVININEIR